jgi:hypothetical protein
MTTTTTRCDRIIALIDECLAEHDSTLRVIAGGAQVPSSRNSTRHLHAVRSTR